MYMTKLLKILTVVAITYNIKYNVKNRLVDYEFVDIFDDAHVLNTKSFPLVFKMKVIEMYKCEWYDTVNKSTVMDLYKKFKPDFGYEMYLDVLPKYLRIFFSRLRMSVHPLRIQTGRYTNDNRPRNERCCMVCNLHDLKTNTTLFVYVLVFQISEKNTLIRNIM